MPYIGAHELRGPYFESWIGKLQRSDGKKAIVLSKKARALSTSLSRNTSDRTQKLLGQVSYHYQLYAWWKLDSFILAATVPSTRHLYVLRPRYDSTPLKVKSKGLSSKASCMPESTLPSIADSTSVAIQASCQSIALVRWTPLACEKATTVVVVSHVVQLEHVQALLLEPKPGYFVAIIGLFANHLSITARTNARCTLASLLQQCPVTPASKSYRERLRTPTTNNHSANNLTEKTFAQFSEVGSWGEMHLICEVHIVQNIYTSLYPMIEFDLQGVLHHALDKQVSMHMNLYRKALRKVVLSRRFKYFKGILLLECCNIACLL